MVRAVQLLGLGAAAGIIFFYTFIVTGNSFAVLGQSTAAELLRKLFPAYYKVQIVLFAVPWLSSILAWRAQSRNRGYYSYRSVISGGYGRSAAAIAVLLTVLLLIVMFAHFAILPRIEAVRDAMGPDFAAVGTPLRAQWGSLHGLSMGLNIATLLGSIAAFFWIART